MHDNTMCKAATLRPDLQVIAQLIAPNARVLDVGCGDGALLTWLRDEKQVDGRGIEINQAAVNQAISNGIPVIQGDVDSDLPHYPDAAYDYVILSQTLQAMRDPRAVLLDLVRIGKKAVVSVPNFGHWKNRLYLALYGRMPVTKTLSYQWYDTPNIHFCTISDFVVLVESLGMTIEQRVVVDTTGRKVNFSGRGFTANLFGEQGVFLLSSQ
ncbi:MAG: methionine biosynthesis protein MetW [Rickettsiales bacterium]|nr:methionine biosynthesis protein MetW [Rickettsiales bacterium]